MKSLHWLLILLIALAAGFTGSRLGGPQATAPIATVAPESAYARVIRTKTLRCGYGLWPGSTDRDPNTGAMSGWVPAVAEELGKKLGLKIEWTAEIPIGQQAEALRSRRIDALCSSDGPWSYTDAAFVDWTHPIIYYPIYLVIRENETRFATLDDFNKPGVTFTAMDGDVTASLYRDWMPNARRLDVPENGDPSLLVLNVDGNKADAVFMDQQTLKRVAEKTPIHLKKFSDQPFTVVPASFTVAKGDYEMMQMLNQGIDMLKDMNIIRKIFTEQGLTDAVLLPATTWQSWPK